MIYDWRLYLDQTAPPGGILLNVIDDVTKECLAAISDTSISGKRVVREMRAIIDRHGRAGLHARAEARLALYRAWQADAERHGRKLPGPDAG